MKARASDLLLIHLQIYMLLSTVDSSIIYMLLSTVDSRSIIYMLLYLRKIAALSKCCYLR